ncbi:Asp-tRNA(Asn)/Glu-tRNA(Gln) amidotransferase subunit GatA [Pajaroellobacter abortibovis]|uniref:Glutamyl-tRNA(Gln) amidotransferase subunit A n=1 Tax=Pajaroellobacter abortibovis TaxID=1882918 RepID=A0A1L6MXG7_9BACT|nr:Asp-tRNA(Asn)/Glu-tRNA(Gln) amidotransferase subunit GatA [Pajaroellobacter abortibovis]APS00169.1 aspartyl/glutamyl-tRNA amidotransferase subunit A [Pajaroellobacter abortibovis]
MTVETWDICTLVDQVQRGEIKVTEIAAMLLQRVDTLNPRLNAFLTINPEQILAEAQAIDDKRAAKKPLGLLAGVPIAIKDSIVTRGVRTTCASKILKDYLPPYDATVIHRLRAADALLFGKTNLDEFAMGSSTENSAFGPTRNPWDLERTPGGSSGGSAAAVAARLCLGSLGSDTGGSIRQPASLTGIVGIRGSYGRVSRYGLVAFASSLDQIGPLATDVRGAARMLSILSGADPHDATCLNLPSEDFEAACTQSVRGLRIGIPEEYFGEGLDPEVEKAISHAIEELKNAGCTLHLISLPHTSFALATYYILANAEASSNLARFDGVRYGLRLESLDESLFSKNLAYEVASMYGTTRSAGFGPEVKRRILLGTFVLSSEYYDAYYLKSQKIRTLIRSDFDNAFSHVDVICSPTAPTSAFKLGEKIDNPLAMYLSDVYTLPASLAGISSMSVPAAFTSTGLPIGLQIMAPSLQESTMLTVAKAWEERANLRHKVPAFL